MTWSNSGVVTPPGEIANSSFMKKHSVILFCSVFGFDQTPLDAIHNWGTSTPCTCDYLYPQSLCPKNSIKWKPYSLKTGNLSKTFDFNLPNVSNINEDISYSLQAVSSVTTSTPDCLSENAYWCSQMSQMATFISDFCNNLYFLTCWLHSKLKRMLECFAMSTF